MKLLPILTVMAISATLFTSCSNESSAPDNFPEQRAECFKKFEIESEKLYKTGDFRTTLIDINYSPSLNSCIARYAYDNISSNGAVYRKYIKNMRSGTNVIDLSTTNDTTNQENFKKIEEKWKSLIK